MSKRLKGYLSTCISVCLTLFGLSVVTFFIGRVMPTDPVLAAVGDNAPQAVVAGFAFPPEDFAVSDLDDAGDLFSSRP